MKQAFSGGNRIELLCTGTEYFPALITAINAARHEVRLESYIFAHDESGRAVAAALKAAAQRGVRVHVVVDGFGSPYFMDKVGRMLIAAGAEVFIYRPEIARLRFRRHRLRRLHRKLVCIDACIAFVGGINIISDFSRAAPTAPRYDFAVRINGPLLVPIHSTMCRLWSLLRWVNVGRRYAAPLPQMVCVDEGGSMRAAFLVRNNLRNRRDIENAYLAAIGKARHEIILANAYFLPGRRFRHALLAAAARGVNITLLVQGRIEYRIQHYASHIGYRQLLASGVSIHEYRKSFLHAKVAVIDGHWSTVGSSNIDPFSLFLAREANVVVEDVKFAAELREKLLVAIADGALPLQSLQPLPWYRRFLGWMAYGLARTVLGLIGYGRDF